MKIFSLNSGGNICIASESLHTMFSTDITDVAFLSKWVTNDPVHNCLAKEYSLNFADSFFSFLLVSLLIIKMVKIFLVYSAGEIFPNCHPFLYFLLFLVF